MFEALLIAASGVYSQQKRLDVISDNVANVDTLGHKSTRVDFKDALYTQGLVPGRPYTPDGDQAKGHGVLLSATTRDIWRQGALVETKNEYDLAIDGKGFFELRDTFGNAVYTRAGNFYSSDGGDGQRYMVNAEGYFVVGADGERIAIPADVRETRVLTDGTVQFLDGDGGEISSAQLGIYTFTNEMGLLSVGNSNFTVSDASGEPLRDGVGGVLQGYTEASNVELAAEFTRMVRTQRAFQLASRALTTADDMEGIANNLRK